MRRRLDSFRLLLFLTGWLVGGPNSPDLSCALGGDEVGAVDIQRELDRRKESLNAFLKSQDPEERVKILESVRQQERRLLGKPLPGDFRVRLIDEHVGLLEHLAGHFQWDQPRRALQFRQEIVEARIAIHPDPGEWRIALARAELTAARSAAELPDDKQLRFRQAGQRTRQALALIEQGEFARAEPLLDEAADILTELFGKDCITTGQIRRMQGQLLLELDRGQEAAQACFSAAEVVRRTVGDCPLLVGALGDCASGLHVAGETAQAVEMQRHAVAAAIEVFGRDSAEYATQINNLAYFLSETGSLPEALKLVEEAGSIYATLGRAEAIADNANLAGTLSMKAGRYAQALAAFEKAAELQSRIKGDRHFHVAVAWGNASQAALELDRLRDADLHIMRALIIIDDTMGRNDPRVADLLIQLASVRREQRRMKEAAPLMEQACRLLEERYGDDHPAYALASLNLAAMRFEQGRYREAEEILINAADVFEVKLGPKSWALAATLTRLAQVQARSQRGDLARQALDVAGRIAVEALEQQHPESADYLRRVADVYRDLQDGGPAIAAMNQAVHFAEQRYGDRHPEYATALVALGEILLETEDEKRGAALIKQGTGLLVDLLGKEHPEVLEATLEMARMHRLMNDPEQALKELVDLGAIVEQELGRENAVSAEMLLETGRNLLITGDIRGAESRLLDAGTLFAEQYGEQHPQAREVMELIASARSGDPSRITNSAIHRLEQEAVKRLEPVANDVDKEAAQRTQRVAEMMQRLAH